MKKTTILLILLSSFYFGQSQNLTYGIVVGGNFYDIEVKGPLTGASAQGLNFGGYVDYKLNKKIGVKANIIYNKTTESKSYDIINENVNTGRIFNEIKLSTLQFHGFIKYDVNSEYNKGFYGLAGLKLNNILKATPKTDKDLIDGFYKKSNLGALIGFGTCSEYISVELVGDFGITNALDSENNKTKNIGVYVNLNINLASFFNN